MIITSNSEKELPDAFLRQCIFHYIEFPDEEMMESIVKVHYPDIEDKLMREAIKKFYWIRQVDGLRKKPSTSELLDWIKALAMGASTSKRSPRSLLSSAPLSRASRTRTSEPVPGEHSGHVSVQEKVKSKKAACS